MDSGTYESKTIQTEEDIPRNPNRIYRSNKMQDPRGIHMNTQEQPENNASQQSKTIEITKDKDGLCPVH